MSIRIRNLGEFNAELERFGRRVVPEQHLALQKRIALDLLRRIVFKTPVDTGRARGNWQTSTGEGNNRALERLDPSGNNALAQGVSAVSAAQPYGLITIFNNVEYIRFLEMGSSRQAPTGMVAVSLAEVRGAFN